MGFAKFGWTCLCSFWGEDENVKRTYMYYYDVMTGARSDSFPSTNKLLITIYYFNFDKLIGLRIIVEIVSLEGALDEKGRLK